MKDPNNKGHLIVDENLRSTIRKIFDLALDGNGVRKIMIYLSNHKILKPSAYQYQNGNKGFENCIKSGLYNWTECAVREILRSPIYCGDIAGYKRPTISFKNKKRKSKKPEEWEVVKDTHEGIITREEFETVQKIMNSRRKAPLEKGYVNVFAGIIKCADCGYRMRALSAHRRKRPNIIDCVQYSCGSYSAYGVKSCSSHMIEARTLIDIVLKDINYYAQMAKNDKSSIKKLQNQLKTMSNKEYNSYQKEIKNANKRLFELDNIISSLYEDKVLKRISEHSFEKMSEKYQIEQKQLLERLDVIKNETAMQEQKEQGVIDFVELIKDYEGIQELTTKIVNTLIDRIEVSERYKNENGEMEQDVKIFYKLIGTISDVKYDVQKVKPMLAERDCVCVECGEHFKTTANNAKYCEECSKIVRKRQWAESNKKRREKGKNL